MNEAAAWVDLSGKCAHVTGGAKGIGAAIARALSMAGARVMLSDVNVDDARATADEIGATAIALDVSDRAAVDAAMRETVEQLGGLDILVNNAGLFRGYGGLLADITDEMWRELWSVNVDGLFYCTRAAVPYMKERGGGRVINLASTQAISPGVGVTYDGSKAAITQMTRTLALELTPHNINVNALAPGPTWTNEGDPPVITGDPPPATGQPLTDHVANRIARLPAGRWGDPMDIGKVALFLASELSDFVTGAYLPVDGGFLTL